MRTCRHTPKSKSHSGAYLDLYLLWKETYAVPQLGQCGDCGAWYVPSAYRYTPLPVLSKTLQSSSVSSENVEVKWKLLVVGDLPYFGHFSRNLTILQPLESCYPTLLARTAGKGPLKFLGNS